MNKRIATLSVFLMVSCGFISSIFAEDIRIQRVLNTEKVNLCIAQDKNGLLLIGTEGGGLLCYNGNEIKKIKIGEEQNPLQMIPSIFVDSEGIIWVLIQGQGLFSYDKNSGYWKRYKSEVGNPRSLTSDKAYWSTGLRIIDEDKEGLIWIGTSDGLNSYDKKKNEFTQYRHIRNDTNSLSNNCIWAVFVDRDGIIWIGTEDGLNSYNKKTNTFSCYKHDPNNINSLSDSFVKTVNEDKNGILWIGTKHGGMCSLNKKTEKITVYKHDPNEQNSLSYDEVSHIMIDCFNNLWICTEGGTGIDKYDIKNNIFKNYSYDSKNPNSISSNEIMYSFEDKSGILWLVDSSGGINKCTFKKDIFKVYSHDTKDPYSLISDNLACLHEDKRKNIWIGAFKSGLGLYLPNNRFEKFTPINNDSSSLPSSTVYSIIDASDDKLWIGNIGDFISLFDTTTKKVIKSFKSPYSMDTPCNLVIDNEKPEFIWFASYCMGGLFKLSTKSGRIFLYEHNSNDPYSVSNKNTFHILQDAKILWIGTGGDGLVKFDKTTGKCLHYRHDPNDKNSISGNVVLQSYIDKRDNFWVTTDDGGINKFDRKTGYFTHYGIDCGFPSNSTRHVLEDKEGFLWVSTDSGLVIFDTTACKVIKRFTAGDGLPSNQFDKLSNPLKDSKGNFWFSTLKGLCTFAPVEAGKIESNIHPPQIVLSTFRAREKGCDDCSLRRITGIKLNWPDNSFEFTFASLDYMDPEKNQHAYKLEGFDKEWNYIGTNHYGKYTNIPPGEYILHLKGSNNDSLWNEKGISIKLKIMPPFWMTLWFKGLIGLILLGTILGGIHLRIRTIKKRAVYMKDHAIAKTVAQVAHDIRSPLASLNMISKTLSELPEQKRVIIRNATQRINDIANNLLEKYEINDEGKNVHVDIKKDMKSELVSSLLDFLVSEKRVQAAHKSIDLILEIENSAYSSFVSLDAREFKRVISNLINNAAEAIHVTRGIIRLTLEKESDMLTIKIVDNGKGIAADILPKIRQGGISIGKKKGCGLGIAGAIQNIKKWNGTYDIQSKEGEGTTFIIRLPITEPPNWFQSELNIVPGMKVIVLDDDRSIHDVWETLLQEYIQNKQIVLEHFYNPPTFIEYYQNLSPSKLLCLIDYELLGFEETGLDLIEKFDLKNHAILVTSHYEELMVRAKTIELGVKTIPKNFASHVGIVCKTFL